MQIVGFLITWLICDHLLTRLKETLYLIMNEELCRPKLLEVALDRCFGHMLFNDWLVTCYYQQNVGSLSEPPGGKTNNVVSK